MECLQNKNEIRDRFRTIRASISVERRKQSSASAAAEIALFQEYPLILSYSSIHDEFDTSGINEYLASQGRLLLPRVTGMTLSAHFVSDPRSQLSPNQWGIPEPIPALCPEIEAQAISLALIPGLAFDRQNHRIGYGKGFYDRFLRNLSPASLILGLGFKEQLSSEPISHEPHDFPLSGIRLY